MPTIKNLTIGTKVYTDLESTLKAPKYIPVYEAFSKVWSLQLIAENFIPSALTVKTGFLDKFGKLDPNLPVTFETVEITPAVVEKTKDANGLEIETVKQPEQRETTYKVTFPVSFLLTLASLPLNVAVKAQRGKVKTNEPANDLSEDQEKALFTL